MQHEEKWKNWPVLLLGVVVVVAALVSAYLFRKHTVLSNYLADLGGAISAIIISIATYDEWERRQERKRYVPPEKQGLNRIKAEIGILLYQYAFILGPRLSNRLSAMENLKKGSIRTTDDKLKMAKQSAKSEINDSKNIFKISREALKDPQLNKLGQKDAAQLLRQIEKTVRQIDLSVATYGYSFTPEIHQKVLKLRENLDMS
jgi:hypothetical protein